MSKQFSDLGFRHQFAEALNELKIVTPTEIQGNTAAVSKQN
jgi:superfamily II DNA/RNA helicase